jgi:hypothetical protein
MTAPTYTDKQLQNPLTPAAAAFTRELFARCTALSRLARTGAPIDEEKAAIEREAARLHPNLGDQVRARLNPIQSRTGAVRS